MKLSTNTLWALGLVSLLCGGLSGGCGQYHNGPPSDHYDGRRFFNPGKPHDKNFASFLKWKFTAERGPWPEYRELPAYDRPPARVGGGELRLSFIGHVSVLLQTEGLNILFDPVFSERASPFSWLGPKRVHPPGVAFADLPPIDLVLISHNHYDHLDLATIAALWQRDRPRIIVPLGNEALINRHDQQIAVEAYDWGGEVAVSETVTVHLEPMHHWSARGLFDRNEALWAAFALTTPHGNIYLVGDSGYGDGDNFRAAREKFGSFRLALLPIGAYEPRWFMAYAHMDPAESLQAAIDLGRPWVLPTHYQLFRLTDEGYDEPLARLQQLLAADPTNRHVVPLQAGESWQVPGSAP